MSVQRTHECVYEGGIGMCVARRHGLGIVADNVTMRLHMHLLADWSFVRSIGSEGVGKGQFDFWCGGLCVSPDGDSVLVAESKNNRVQQVRIVDGLWVRFVGKGVLRRPQHVDCNADVIVVSETYYAKISAFSWADGSVRAQFGGYGHFGNLRLLADGNEMVVVDRDNHRLCVFGVSGEFVAAVGSKEQGLYRPWDVLEYVTDGGFIVLDSRDHNLIKCDRAGVNDGKYGTCGDGNGEFKYPAALAALPDGGIVVRDCGGRRFSIFRDHCHRLQWIGLCLSVGTGVRTMRLATV